MEGLPFLAMDDKDIFTGKKSGVRNQNEKRTSKNLSRLDCLAKSSSVCAFPLSIH
jgi:hypothetical protein